jgi:hypothetical protein
LTAKRQGQYLYQESRHDCKHPRRIRALSSIETAVAAGFPFCISACSAKLFSTNADVPVKDALEAASTYLSVALALVESNPEHSVWGMHYLTELAKVIVDSVVGGQLTEGGAA